MVNIVDKPVPVKKLVKKKPGRPKKTPSVNAAVAAEDVVETKKPKQKEAKTAVKALTSKQAKKLKKAVDVYGDLAQTLAAKHKELEPLIAEALQAKTEMLEFVELFQPADQEITHVGKRFIVVLGMKGATTTLINKEQAKQYLEDNKTGLFQSLATIPIGKLKEYLTPEQVAEVTEVERIHARPLTVGTKKAKTKKSK